MTDNPPLPRVLIVDDDGQVRQLHRRVLSNAGFDVDAAEDGHAALAAVQQAPYDAILTDIDMPGMNGIDLLERVRLHDIDVPVILITGAPSFETAIQALDRGALKYLQKPVDLPELVRVIRDAVRLHRIAIAKRQALALIDSAHMFAGDQAGLAASFERALATIHMVYQPIVTWSARVAYGFEALLRSDDDALPSPFAMIDAAERLGRLHDLGRRTRGLAIEQIVALPSAASLFINLHPAELLDDDLLRNQQLAAIADRVVLEVTERSSLERLPDVRARIQALRRRGFRFALDDFGAGYGGLTSFVLLQPDIVKLDMGLCRGIEREPTKRTLVETITNMCLEMQIAVIAEGVETAAERDTLLSAGCDLQQGYLFGRPAPLPAPSF